MSFNAHITVPNAYVRHSRGATEIRRISNYNFILIISVQFEKKFNGSFTQCIHAFVACFCVFRRNKSNELYAVKVLFYRFIVTDFMFSEENHLHMINHVFLPRNLPTEFKGNYNDHLDKVETSL